VAQGDVHLPAAQVALHHGFPELAHKIRDPFILDSSAAATNLGFGPPLWADMLADVMQAARGERTHYWASQE
jgi:hypothetical protein